MHTTIHQHTKLIEHLASLPNDIFDEIYEDASKRISEINNGLYDDEEDKEYIKQAVREFDMLHDTLAWIRTIGAPQHGPGEFE